MKNLVTKLNNLTIWLHHKATEQKFAIDQIIVMFFMIAVAAGIAGMLYAYGTNTLIPTFENKLNTLINNWFDHI